MSAIAEDVETTGAIKKANAKQSATATAAKKPGATPAH
jgi:hypothetical protein